jgi:hypothetical protein
MMHDGWCPDCDLPSVVIDVDDQGEHRLGQLHRMRGRVGAP